MAFAHRTNTVYKVPRVILYCGVFCAVAIGRFLWITHGPESQYPRLSCSEFNFDFGRINKDTKLFRHVFSLSNLGRKPLHIFRASPSCPFCLSVSLEKTHIISGDNTNLVVTLQTEGLGIGKFEKTVVLNSNDPDVPYAVLTLTGVVCDATSK